MSGLLWYYCTKQPGPDHLIDSPGNICKVTETAFYGRPLKVAGNSLADVCLAVKIWRIDDLDLTHFCTWSCPSLDTHMRAQLQNSC